MNCPECRSSSITHAHCGEYVCSECGIVLEDLRVFDYSPMFSLSHTPVKPMVLPGTAIGFSAAAPSDLVRRLRQTQKHSLISYTKEQTAWYQCKHLKTVLELPITDAALIGRYAQIRKRYPKACRISAKNMASVIFYRIAKEYRFNFTFAHYLAAAELTRHQFWGINKVLHRFTAQNDDMYWDASVTQCTAAELSRAQDVLGLPAIVMRLAFRLVTLCELSPIARINAAAILVASQRYLKDEGMLEEKKIPARRIFAFLTVAPATAYAKIGAWKVAEKCAAILCPIIPMSESEQMCCESIVSTAYNAPISLVVQGSETPSRTAWQLWKPMVVGHHLGLQRDFSRDYYPSTYARLRSNTLLILLPQPSPDLGFEKRGALDYFLSSSRGKSPPPCLSCCSAAI